MQPLLPKVGADTHRKAQQLPFQHIVIVQVASERLLAAHLLLYRARYHDTVVNATHASVQPTPGAHAKPCL